MQGEKTDRKLYLSILGTNPVLANWSLTNQGLILKINSCKNTSSVFFISKSAQLTCKPVEHVEKNTESTDNVCYLLFTSKSTFFVFPTGDVLEILVNNESKVVTCDLVSFFMNTTNHLFFEIITECTRNSSRLISFTSN
jgi:hypothetical protein